MPMLELVHFTSYRLRVNKVELELEAGNSISRRRGQMLRCRARIRKPTVKPVKPAKPVKPVNERDAEQMLRCRQRIWLLQMHLTCSRRLLQMRNIYIYIYIYIPECKWCKKRKKTR